MNEHIFSRTELLIGDKNLNKLKNSTVVVFGIGGVGSFATEALCRAGIGNLILIDNDTVSISNLNRQIIATMDTLDKPKVEVMKNRILSINPQCNIVIHQVFVNESNIESLIPKNANYVIDAIDTVSSKIALVLWCENNNIPIISSMGTGNKLDPTKFQIADIYSTKICPLAKVMRYELKKRAVKKLKVLYSEELPMKPIVKNDTPKENIFSNNDDDIKVIRKRQTPASISFVPPVAGMIIAGDVIKTLLEINK